MISHANLELTDKKWPSIQRLAKKNVPAAMYLMGVAYLLGGLVEVDNDKSYFWFCRAAGVGHADAAFRAGFLLQHNKVQDPLNTPASWFNQACHLGSAAGCCAVANQWTYSKLSSQKWWHKYFGGQDNSLAAQESFQLYERASRQSYAAADYYLGIHSLKGWGCTRNKELAMQHFSRAVQNKDKDAAFSLALCHPYNSAPYWMHMEQAADWGCASAQYKLALALLTRRSTASNEAAVSWLRKASIQRHPKAMLLLSQTLFFGRHLPEDIPNAWRWARRCCAVGGCSQSWVDKLFHKLTPEQQQSLSLESIEDDEAFHAMSEKLFGTPGTF